jgi:hypothetical protein
VPPVPEKSTMNELTESELDTVSAAGSHHHHKENVDKDSKSGALAGTSNGGTVQGGPVLGGYDLKTNEKI